jgi:peptidyl-Asp metalloendopeptidase
MKLSSPFRIQRLACAVLAGFAVFFLNPVSAAAGDAAPGDLFTDADAGAAADLRPSGVVLRQHAVRINTGVLKEAMKPGALINFNLFPDTACTGMVETVETRGETGFTLVGHVQGKDVSNFVLVGNGDVVVMNVRPGSQGLTQVRYLGDGIHVVRQVDENLFPPCENTAAHVIRNSAVAADVRPQGGRQVADLGDVIDVMVIYTPAARIAAGGTNAIQALITLAFTESNTAYQQSLINPRIRLVYQQEIAYTESGSFSTDLSRVTNPSDGYMDEVLGLRNTYGADLVSLWIDNSASCGIGWLMGSLSPAFESNGYSVVYWSCATGYYSFAHEMGHNMGCQHDVGNAAGQPGLYSYSYGWRFTGTDAVLYRTIMAYDPGTRIQRFSNPNVNYMGTPTGDASQAYNALTINNSAYIVANFRQSVISTNQSPSIDVQPVSQTVPVGANVTFSVQVSGSAPLVYQWRTNNTPIPGANLDHYSITNVQFSNVANYSVYVTNTFGTATSSNASLTISDLGNALDAPAQAWFTGGSASWVGQTNTTHDGVDAAQSGVITDSQVTWFETTTTNGPGLLTFWWKVSSESGYDFLNLYTNGVLVPGFSISGEVGWQFRSIPFSSGSNTFHWEYSKDPIVGAGQDRAWVDQVSFLTLADAADNAGLNWSSSGNAQWAPDVTTTHDGVDSMASGNIISALPYQHSILQTTVNGPALLTFWWKVSSELNFDYLDLYLDGNLQTYITGEINWTQLGLNIPAGSHTVQWDYWKDDSVSAGQDKGWVDQAKLVAASRIVSNSFLGGLNPQFSLQFTGLLGGSYTIQASSNLLSWANLTNVISTTSSMPFVDTGASNYNSRFYRVISP